MYFCVVAVLQGSPWFLLVVGRCKRSCLFSVLCAGWFFGGMQFWYVYFLSWMLVLGMCSHCLSISNVDCGVIGFLIWVYIYKKNSHIYSLLFHLDLYDFLLSCTSITYIMGWRELTYYWLSAFMVCHGFVLSDCSRVWCYHGVVLDGVNQLKGGSLIMVELLLLIEVWYFV